MKLQRIFRHPWRGSLALALLAWANSAMAHDLWIERQEDRHTLYYGHGRSGHEGVKYVEYLPERVRAAQCFDAKGKASRVEIGSTYPVVLRGNCEVVWVLTSSGYWSKTPYGTKNVGKAEAGMVLDSWLSFESVKRVDAWSPALSRPLTRELEIAPQIDPMHLKPGDKLPLRVFRDALPVAGVTVAYFGHPRGVTDADGRVNVRLRDPGYQLIQASLELPLADGKADRVVHATALVFEPRP